MVLIDAFFMWMFLQDEHQINNPLPQRAFQVKLLKHSWQVWLSYEDVSGCERCPLVSLWCCCIRTTLQLSTFFFKKHWKVCLQQVCLCVEAHLKTLTQPAVTAVSAWVRSACRPPGWRCRWSPRWPTARRSCPRSPGPGSGAGCSRTEWSGRPWGGPGRRVPHSFQPEKDADMVRRSVIILLLLLLST